MNLKRENLRDKVEPHIFDKLKLLKYPIFKDKSYNLLSANRLDVGFKLFYLQYLEKNKRLALDVYHKSLKANKLFKIEEYGNYKKNSLKSFELYFKELLLDIKNDGFNINKSIVPINKNNEILNGSHRVATTVFLGEEISYVKTEIDDFEKQDYNYFYRRNISQNLIEQAVLAFTKFSQNVHIAFVWPRAEIDTKILKSKFDNILYYKEITFNFSAAHYFVSQVYSGDFWTGNYEDQFKGSLGKVKECFQSNRPLRIIYFTERDKSIISNTKTQIRDICKVDKHSIHITDHKNEVDRISKIILNKNSISFLNKANIFKYKENFQIINKFKDFLNLNKLDIDDIIIDSSFIMSIYGIRKAKDLDFICNSFIEKNNHNFFNVVNERDLNYHKINKKDLIYDSNNFFYFQGIKFITLKNLYYKKKKRGEVKDLTDIKLIESYMDRNTLRLFLNTLKQRHYYFNVILRVYIIKFLKFIRLHKPIKSIYNLFLKK